MNSLLKYSLESRVASDSNSCLHPPALIRLCFHYQLLANDCKGLQRLLCGLLDLGARYMHLLLECNLHQPCASLSYAFLCFCLIFYATVTMILDFSCSKIHTTQSRRKVSISHLLHILFYRFSKGLCFDIYELLFNIFNSCSSFVAKQAHVWKDSCLWWFRWFYIWSFYHWRTHILKSREPVGAGRRMQDQCKCFLNNPVFLFELWIKQWTFDNTPYDNRGFYPLLLVWQLYMKNYFQYLEINFCN